MTKFGYPPFFSPKLLFTKITQNGPKWILNITFKTVKFFWFNPPSPQRWKISRNFFFLMKASLIHYWETRCQGQGQSYDVCAVCGTQFMQGVDSGYCRPRRIRRRKTLLLSLNRYGAFMPASNQFSPSKHRQRELCNLNLKLSFCAKVSFSLLQILCDSWYWVPFALIILTQNFWNTANQIENWESRRRPVHPG